MMLLTRRSPRDVLTALGASVGHHSPRLFSMALGLIAVLSGLLIARAPLTTVLAVVSGLVLLGGTIIEPLVGIGAALLFGPLRAWLDIRMPGPYAYFGQVVLVFALAVWLASGMLDRRVRFPTPALFCPLIAFLWVGLLSLWQPVDVWSGALEFLKWLQVLLVAVVVYDGLRHDTGTGYHARLIVALFALSAVFQALVGLWQFGLRGEGVAEFAINARFYRAYGTFQQPNPYAGLLGMSGALLVGITGGVWLDRRRSADRRSAVIRMLPVGASAVLLAVGLLASWSRGGWMGFGAAGLVLLVLLPRRLLLGVVLVATLVAVGGGLAVTGRLPNAIVSRLTSFAAYVRFEDVRGAGITDENFAVMERMAHWQAALEMWRSRFWLGVGLGDYEAAYPQYALINWPLPLGHAHNFYLNLLAETGLVGLITYGTWLATMLAASVWATRRATGWPRGIALGLAGAWTHLAVHSLVDNLLVNNVHMHVGVLVALTAWVTLVTRRSGRRAGKGKGSGLS